MLSSVSTDEKIKNNRLGGSCLAQVYGRIVYDAPDCEDPQTLQRLAQAVGELCRAALIAAYHDRSDGGLFVTLVEMAFAGHCGVEVDLGTRAAAAAALFSEELGVVLQIRTADLQAAQAIIERHDLAQLTRQIGVLTPADRVLIRAGTRVVLDEPRTQLRRAWAGRAWA